MIKKLAIAAALFLSSVGALAPAQAAEDVFGSAFTFGGDSVDGGLNVNRSNINKSDLGVTAINSQAGNTGEFTGKNFNVNFGAVAISEGRTSATGNLNDSTLNGGGSLSATANGAASVPGFGIGGQVELSVEDKSSFIVNARGAVAQNGVKIKN